LRFNFVVAAPKGPHSSVFVRRVPPVAGEPFTQPSVQGFFNSDQSLIARGLAYFT
jgi:hypothetical protein